MSRLTITLDNKLTLDELNVENTPGWWRDGLLLIVRTETSLATYQLPKGSKRIVLQHVGGNRARLSFGGFTTTSGTIVGPPGELKKIREAML